MDEKFIIGDSEIKALQDLIITKFEDFRSKFKEKYKADIFDSIHHNHFDSIWTCYINGKGKNYKVDSWEGIFKIWMDKIFEKSELKPEIQSESWYRVDQAVVESPVCWWDGKYRILLLFEHENNPEEIKGHTRQFSL